MAGNCGLWIGCTMISFAEFVVVTIQIILWICGCPKERELPEVPSCHVRNFFAEGEEQSEGDGSTDRGEAAGPSVGGSSEAPPKNFVNILGEKGKKISSKKLTI